ncbi:MAG: Bcr/CflA family efflux MFS transporter [Cellvibrionaceae bacterium]
MSSASSSPSHSDTPSTTFILLLGFLVGLSPFAIDMYLSSFLAIEADLLASQHAVESSVGVYLIFFAIPQLFFGPLSDAYGRRFAIFCGLGCYILGALLCATAQSIEVFLLARALQGTGSAAISVTVPTIVKDRFSGAVYTRTVGFIMMVMSIAPLIAPMAGTVVFYFGGWRSIFYVLVVLSVICALLFNLIISESSHVASRTPLNLKNLFKNYSTLFSDRYCLGLAMSVGFMLSGLMAFITGSPFLFMDDYGISQFSYSILFGVNVAAMMIFTYVNNRLIHSVSNENLLRAAVIAVVVASVYLLGLGIWESMGNPVSLMAIIIGCVLYIANLGMITANIQVILISRFSYISGATSAVVGTIRFGIGSLGGFAYSYLSVAYGLSLSAVMALCGFCVLLSYLFAGKPVPRTEIIS